MSGKGSNGQERVSRIIVDFEGPGLANVVKFRCVNVTPGQILVLAEWARAQADLVLARMVASQRPDGPQIVVPRIVPRPPG